MNIQEKIDKLKDMYKNEADRKDIFELEKRFVEGTAINSLSEKEGVITIVSLLESRKESINKALVNDRNMKEDLRTACFHLKDDIEWLLKLFNKVDLNLLEEEIDNDLI